MDGGKTRGGLHTQPSNYLQECGRQTDVGNEDFGNSSELPMDNHFARFMTASHPFFSGGLGASIPIPVPTSRSSLPALAPASPCSSLPISPCGSLLSLPSPPPFSLESPAVLIPDDVLPLICSFLRARELLVVGSVSVQMYKISRDPQNWVRLCKSVFGISVDELSPPDAMKVYELMQTRLRDLKTSVTSKGSSSTRFRGFTI